MFIACLLSPHTELWALDTFIHPSPYPQRRLLYYPHFHDEKLGLRKVTDLVHGNNQHVAEAG